MQSVTPQDAARLMDQGALLVDIREPAELARIAIPGALSLPLSRLDAPDPVLTPGKTVLFLCASGGRTGMHVARLAARARGCEARVVAGGVAAWQRAGLPVTGGEPGAGPALSPLTLGILALTGGALGVSVSPWFFAIPAALLAWVVAPRLVGRG